ncbi:MAG: hypothetical protein ABIJ31_09120 [Pseudomonadota bacterium]
MNLIDKFLNKKNQYSFSTSWDIDAPLELVWNELINYQKWPTWCRSLEKIEQRGFFDAVKRGNTIRSTWKGVLPYRITFDSVVDNVTQYSFLSFDVTGDLYGQGMCYFRASHDITTIHFIWNVSPTKLWIKMSSPFARVIFIENHNYIMDQTLAGFVSMITRKTQSMALNKTVCQ